MSYGDIKIAATGKYLRIETGQPREVRILDETPFEKVVHGFGKDAINCQAAGCDKCAGGDTPKQRFATNVWDHSLQKAMIWEFGPNIAKQLCAIDKSLAEEGRKITDVDLKVESSGEKLSKKYMITPRMSTRGIPESINKVDLSVPF